MSTRGMTSFAAWCGVLMLLVFARTAFGAAGDDAARALGEMDANVGELAQRITVTTELLMIREALGEISAADRQRTLSAEVAQLRSAPEAQSLTALKRERSAAVERLIRSAEARVPRATWPRDGPPAYYVQRARLSLHEARVQLAYLNGLDASPLDAARIAAEALGWTQGRVGDGRRFDAIDQQIDAVSNATFTKLPVPASVGVLGGSHGAGTPPVTVAPGAPPAAPAASFEYDVDRHGGDYRGFDLAIANPQYCADQCARENACRSWTYVKPGVQARSARCWLKSTVSTPVRGVTTSISGVTRPLAPSPAPARGHAWFAGRWNAGGWGILALAQNGNAVNGTFNGAWGNGTLTGALRGTVLQGEFSRSDGARFSFSAQLMGDGRSFRGAAATHGWTGAFNGVRI